MSGGGEKGPKPIQSTPGHWMVSLCLEPEITLGVFSSNGSKNRERLFQTKRQKIVL